jgi:hypothetical protein
MAYDSARLTGLAARRSPNLTHNIVDRSSDRSTEAFRSGAAPVLAARRCATEYLDDDVKAGGLPRGKPGQPGKFWIRDSG